jgi:hypothetical protein
MSDPERRPHGEVDGVVEFSGTENNWSDADPSTAAIEAIASIEGSDPLDLGASGETILYDNIDPDALDKLVTSGQENNIAITFTIADYTVWIGGSDLVVAHNQSDPHTSE